MASVVQTERYLVLDIGHVFTRAFLFDVVDGRYHLVGQSAVPSTWEAPVRDVREGVLSAVEALEQLSGLRLVEEGDIITPSRITGEGVDKIFLLISAGPPIRMALMGILETLSLKSALRAVEPFPVEPVLAFHINDGLSEIRRMERLLNAAPDVVLLVGGTDQGARQALLDYLHMLDLAAPLFPREARPVVLFAGNAALATQIQERLGKAYDVYLADNVRPSLTQESLHGLRQTLKSIYRNHILRHLPGLDGLLAVAHGFEPVSLAWRRMAHVLAAYHQSLSGYIGLHLGSGLSFLTLAREEEAHLRCFAYGLGHGLSHFLEHLDEEILAGWTTLKDPFAEVLYKRAYPEMVPETEAEAWLEWGLAYQMGRRMLLSMMHSADRRHYRRIGLPPEYRFILLGGGVWSTLTRPDALVLTALDLFQPVGLVTLLADVAHLMAPLGILAKENPYVAVHMLRSPHFFPLATVVAPWGHRMRRGREPVARARLQWAPNQRMSVVLHSGEIQVMPLPPGYRGELEVEPIGPYDVGAGPGRTLRKEVVGSWAGVVLDGRGRPLRPPKDVDQHQKARQAWLQAFRKEA